MQANHKKSDPHCIWQRATCESFNMQFSAAQTQLLLLIHAAATWFMVGLIWFVQVVHYPLLARLPATERGTLANLHANLTSLVVAPMMLVEIASAALIAVIATHHGIRLSLAWAGIALIIALWLSTFLVQVPLHAKLQSGSDTAGASLVMTNWVRTFAWSARGIIAAILLLAAFSSHSSGEAQ